VTSDWNVPRTYRREWIVPPSDLDEEVLKSLRQTLRSEPRILEAWLVGSRLWPVDGSPPRESSDIALVLDPRDREDPIEILTGLMERLDMRGQGRGSGRAWLLLSPTVIAAHQEHAAKIYARPTPTT
jgi:hypothetical protein